MRRLLGLSGFVCLVLLAAPARSASVEIGLNFRATTAFESGFFPPDSMMAVSEEHVVELINGAYRVYSKTDGQRLQATTLEGFWRLAGVVPKFFAFDPRVLYDPSTRRWFALAVDDQNDANNFLVAVSRTSDPTAGWTAFQIPSDSANQLWADFPTLGMNAEGLFVTGNMFDFDDQSSFLVNVLVLPKEDLLAGTPSIARASIFERIGPAEIGISPHAVFDPDGFSDSGILLSDLSILASLVRSDITGSIFAPSFEGRTVIETQSFAFPLLAPQPGPKQDLEVCCSDNRFGASVVLQDGSIWAVSTVGLSGLPALRWLEIDAASNEILQTGVVTDDELAFYYGSIAVNELGQVVIGCNGSSESQFVSSYAVVGETANGVTTFGEPVLLAAGVSDYQRVFSGRNRWGDYSATVVDPSDPLSFWTIQEIVVEENVWATQITQIRLGPAVEIVVRKKRVAVTLLGSESFDVAQVNATRLRFGPAAAPPKHNLSNPKAVEKHVEDANGDGVDDLVSHYRARLAGIAPDAEQACLSGETLAGVAFEACDALLAGP